MFDQFGTDYAKQALQLHDLLPSVNRSESAHSILSTLFQRWVTKPNLSNVAGSIGFSKTPVANRIAENIAIRQAYQLYPVFYHEQGDERLVMDWNDMLRKLSFTGVDPTKYSDWGTTSSFEFSPPIDIDKFVNYQNYFWVNSTDTTEQPNYVTIVAGANNDWSDWNSVTGSTGNRWIHKRLLTTNFAFAKQAQLPIIEFNNIQLSRWYKVVRQWNVLYPQTGEFVSTTAQPNLVAISDSDLQNNWELASEHLIPVGDKTLTPFVIAQCTIATQSIDTPQYLRGQNSIRIFAVDSSALGFSEYDQIIEFEEVEQLVAGVPSQYSTQVRLLQPIAATVVMAVIGPHYVDDATAIRTVRLAPSFTTFTPENGSAFGAIQIRDLSTHKLSGQRKLNKYQLPLFNLYHLTGTGTVSDETKVGYVISYTQDIEQIVNTMLGRRVNDNSGDYSFTTDLVDSAGALLTYRLANDATHYTIWKNPSTYSPSYVDSTRTAVDISQPGGWEPSKLLTENPLRETRTGFRFSEVITHFQSVLSGKSGTIKISDDGGAHLVSSLIASNLSMPNLIGFVADELHSFRSGFDIQVRNQLLSNTALKSTVAADIPGVVYTMLKNNALYEGGHNAVYDDTLSYNQETTYGYPKFPLTFGILGLTPVTQPSVESDRKLKHAAIVTHDSTKFTLDLTIADTFNIEQSLANSTVSGSSAPVPLTNFCVWRKSTTETYRFECVYFTHTPPTVPAIDDTWYDPTTTSAYVYDGSSWNQVDTQSLWVIFDVAAVILEVIALQERDLITLIEHRNLSVLDWLPLTVSQSPEFLLREETDYNTFKYKYQQQDLSSQLSSRLLTAPSAIDPFTWYYGNVPNWVGSVYQLYLNLFHTPLPNKQPWMIQGYVSKPTWWDVQYMDQTGQRIWSSTMWSNIQLGIIPAGQTLPDNITVSIGTPQVPAVIVIPVNTNNVAVAGYGPDDLLPPYINTATYPQLAGNTLVANVLLLGDYLTFPSTLGSNSYMESIWLTNHVSISRDLIAAYQIAPITTVTTLLDRDQVVIGGVGGIKINIRTNNVIRNTTPLHGEAGAIDNTIFSALTFYARRNNFSHNHNSPLYTWKSWTTRLAYQTNSLVVPQTLKVYQDCYELEDYQVVLKKSENIRKIQFSNVIITLAQAGDSNTLPAGSGDDWVFNLVCSESSPTVRYRYNLLQQAVTWNAQTKTFTPTDISQSLRWTTGEEVKLVSPLGGIVVNKFFVNVTTNHLTLHDTINEAVMGVNSIDYGSLILDGTYWFDSINSQLWMWNNSTWTSVNVTVAETILPQAALNSMWYNSTSRVLIQVIRYDDKWVSSTMSALNLRYDSATQVIQKFDGVLWNDQPYTLVTDPMITQPVLPGVVGDIWYNSTLDVLFTFTVGVQVTVPVTYISNTNLRTIKATFTAGNRVWETVELDRTIVQPFNFADGIQLVGVQSVIDFIVSYTEYMQDDGVVVNIGETTELDPDTNAVISWQQQITKAIDKIYASNGLSARDYTVPMIPNASGGYSPVPADRMYVTTPFAEINPFRTTVYFRTPEGVVCDLNHIPYVAETASTAAVYDDTGAAIFSDEIIPLRTDKLTTVVFNDHQPPRPVNIGQDLSRRIAYGSITLDFYEHVIVFDQQTSNGLVIFDRYFNLQKNKLNIECQKSVDFFYRPVMGGFSVTASNTIPNFEMVGEYQRNDYDVAESNELIQTTVDSRQMLGKLPLAYFQSIPVTSKTEFQFWQQMIRDKGTKESIQSFTRHQLYEDIQYDEFWAWKLGTFGAITPRQQLEMHLTTADVAPAITTFSFASTSPTVVTKLPISIVTPLDASRWIDFPNYLDTVGETGLVIQDQQTSAVSYVVTHSISQIGLTIPTTLPLMEYIAIDLPGDRFDVHYEEYTIDAGVVYCNTVSVSANTTSVEFPSDPVFVTNVDQFKFVVVLNNTVVNAQRAGFSVTLPHPTTEASTITLLILRSDPTVVSTHPLQMVNHELFRSSELPVPVGNKVGIITISGKLPSYSTVSPLRTIDVASKNVVKSHVVWDPANSLHTSAISQFDYIQQNDPAQYNRTQVNATNSPWGSDQLGFYWMDSSSLEYKPYFDAAIFSFDDQTRYWGELVDGAVPVAYQWVESTTAPTIASVDLPLTRLVNKVRATSSDSWVEATATLVQPFYVKLYAYNAPNPSAPHVFDVPTGWVSMFDVTSGAVVHKNGQIVGYDIQVNDPLTPTTATLALLDTAGNPLPITQSDIIVLQYPPQVMNSGGLPPDTSTQLTYTTTEVPYVERVQYINKQRLVTYYYWAANPATIGNPVKTLTLADSIFELTHPTSNNFFAVRGDRTLVTVWGLYNLHNVESKALAIDIDTSIRDHYVNGSISKPVNEQWIIFREKQDEYPHSAIWETVVATVVGLRNINGISTIVPTPSRSTYDYLYDTTLQYGTEPTQALISPARAREIFVSFFSESNPIIDSTELVNVADPAWKQMLELRQFDKACEYAYKFFSATLLNTFVFEILREGLYSGYNYSGLFKTSYVALQTSQKVIVST
jgi:hypothetical protein